LPFLSAFLSHLSVGDNHQQKALSCYPFDMSERPFVLDVNSELRKRAAELACLPDTPEVRRDWLLIADEASSIGDWLLSEYAYKKGLGLQVLW